MLPINKIKLTEEGWKKLDSIQLKLKVEDSLGRREEKYEEFHDEKVTRDVTVDKKHQCTIKFMIVLCTISFCIQTSSFIILSYNGSLSKGTCDFAASVDECQERYSCSAVLIDKNSVIADNNGTSTGGASQCLPVISYTTMQTIEIVCCFTVISLFTLTSFVRQCCCQKKEKSSENLYLANVIVSRNLPLLAVVLTVWMIMVGLSTFREKLDYNFIIVNAGIGLIIFFSNNSIARDIRLSIKIQQSSSQ